jgi:hypothetical protein
MRRFGLHLLVGLLSIAMVRLPLHGQVIAGTSLSGAAVTVTITSPTSSSTYDNGTTSTITLGGTAQSNGTIRSCTYSNSLGGSGSASETTSWSIASVSLTVGDNVITVTCTNASGVTGNDVITVTRSADQPSAGAGIARGCTTAYYIDWDCDGYGPGVRSSGVYGWDVLGVGDMPDADDEDADINTTASVIAAFGSGGSLSNAQLKTFLATLGYSAADNVFYISTTGTSSGTADDPTDPWQNWGQIRTLLDPGDVVVYRAGTYLNPTIGEASPVLNSGTSGNPIIFMSYPGEVVHFNATATTGAWSTSGFGGGAGASWVIFDGFTVSNDTNPFLGSGWSCAGAQNSIIRNVESQQFAYVVCIEGEDNLTVERSIFHHQEQHGFYMGSNTTEASNVILQDSIFYAAGWNDSGSDLQGGGYGGAQFNGRCTGCTFQRNISHSNGGWGLSIIQGVHDSTIANNVLFNNGTVGIVMQIYDGDCDIIQEPDTGGDICPYDTNNNLFINNTIWVGTTNADGNTGPGGNYPSSHAGILIARNTATCVEGGVEVAAINCTMEQTFRNNVIVTTDGPAWRFDMWVADEGEGIDSWAEDSTYQNNLLDKTNSSTTFLRKQRCSVPVCNTENATDYNFASFESTFGGTNINDDPDFVGAATADYDTPEVFDLRVTLYSPARQAASSTGIPALDVRQNTRSGPHDIGAYEFVYPTITWTQPTINAGSAIQPGSVGYTKLVDDPVSGCVMYWTARSGTSIIYSTDMFAFCVTPSTYTHLGGSGSDQAPSGGHDPDINGSRSSVSPWPGDRHPIGNMVYDSIRNRIWIMGGVTSCSPTCQDAAYSEGGDGGGYSYFDLWYYSLNATPTSNTWTRECGTVEPANGDGVSDTCTGGANVPYSHGGIAFDPTRDIIFAFGANPTAFWQTMVYCPGTGSPSTAQSNAGCAAKQQWYDLTPTNEPTSTGAGDYVQWPNPFYDSNVDRMISFNSGGWGLRKVYEYNSETKTFTNLAPSGMPTETEEAASSEWNMAQILDGPYEGLYIYQQTSHLNGTDSAATYAYDRHLNTVVLLTDVGDGPSRIAYITWNRDSQKIVGKQQGNGATWLGELQ